MTGQIAILLLAILLCSVPVLFHLWSWDPMLKWKPWKSRKAWSPVIHLEGLLTGQKQNHCNWSDIAWQLRSNYSDWKTAQMWSLSVSGKPFKTQFSIYLHTKWAGNLLGTQPVLCLEWYNLNLENEKMSDLDLSNHFWLLEQVHSWKHLLLHGWQQQALRQTD